MHKLVLNGGFTRFGPLRLHNYEERFNYPGRIYTLGYNVLTYYIKL